LSAQPQLAKPSHHLQRVRTHRHACRAAHQVQQQQDALICSTVAANLAYEPREIGGKLKACRLKPAENLCKAMVINESLQTP